MGQTQVRNALYALECTDPKTVVVRKMDSDFNVLETYFINPSIPICSCWAGAKDCRHQKMMRLWEKYNLWGKGWMYNFDKNKWIEPTPVEES